MACHDMVPLIAVGIGLFFLSIPFLGLFVIAGIAIWRM